jgi:hypothetical protein
MTMAVGFVCSDGVVIGADRQVTGTGYTFPECKLITFAWKNGHGIIGYSGERDAFINFSREIGLRVPADAVMQDQEVRGLLRDCLQASLSKKDTLLVLFGYWLDGARPSLLMANSNRRIVDVAECEVIGYADSPLARFLLGRLTDLPFGITVSQARIYAAYFISQAKKYDGQYVGGGIDIYSVDQAPNSGGARVHILDAAATDEWEQEVNLFQYKMDVLFHRLSDTASDMNYEFAMNEFAGCAERFRNWTGKK